MTVTVTAVLLMTAQDEMTPTITILISMDQTMMTQTPTIPAGAGGAGNPPTTDLRQLLGDTGK